MSKSRHTALLLLSLLPFGPACSKSEEPAAAVVAPNVRVRNIELPFSRRADDSLGSAPIELLVAYDGISLGGEDLLPLTRGAMTPRQEAPAPIPQLASALPSGKTEAKLRMHASVHVRTLLAVVATLRERGVVRIGFEVRRDSLGENTGLMVVERLDVRATSTEPPVFEGEFSRTWEQAVELWDDAYVACSGSEGSFDCARVTEKVAFGGDAEISLFQRQNGVILGLTRFGTGADVPEAEHFMQQQNDRSGPMRDRDQDREVAPPATRASFGFRWQSLAAEPEAPIAKVMREAVRGGPIGIRVSSDANGEAGAVVTLLGAAFPDGVRGPAVVLEPAIR